jgi:uncharacterized protein (DUF1501 family)
MHSRRDFLKKSSLCALAPTVPGFLAHVTRAARPERDARILVVIELNGGNDGINTVVPFKDEGYAKNRRVLRLPADQLVKLTADIGLHPRMRRMGELWEGGALAVVQGVGYPNPNRSHFDSMAIWHTARLDARERTGLGWLGLGLDHGRKAAEANSAALFVGSEAPPVALRGRRAVASAMDKLEDMSLRSGADSRQVLAAKTPPDDLLAFTHRTMLDAYATADRYPDLARQSDSGGYPAGVLLAEQLRLVAGLIKLDFGARVYYAIQPFYDTHTSQLPRHAELLAQLSASVVAFLDDLKAAGLADRVAVLCFSEFGRRVAENASDGGTDHGTAGPVFLVGPKVRGGLFGTTPRLTDLDSNGDLKTGIDFRRVYATVLEDWLGLSARQALGAAYERLALFRTKTGS